MANLAEQIDAGGEILRDPDAARYVGMSESWLRQTRMLGRTDGPPFIRIGTRAVRYRRRDLDRWLERRLCAVTSEAQPEPGAPQRRQRARSGSGVPRKRKRPRNRASSWRR
jgi:predicted DNA-binding transcriptional regulator AlpA